METQPDALSEDQVVVITSRTRDRLGLLRHKPANCRSPSPKEVRIEIKCLPPAEAGFISKRSIGNKNPRQARQPNMCVRRLEWGGSRSSQLRPWVCEEPGSGSAAERAWWGLGGGAQRSQMASFQRSLKQQSSLLPSIPPFQQPGSSRLPLESGPLPWSLSQQAPP